MFALDADCTLYTPAVGEGTIGESGLRQTLVSSKVAKANSAPIKPD